MDAYVKGALVLVAIAFVVLRFRKKAGNVEASDWRDGELEQVAQVEQLVPPSSPVSKIRLTDLQETALTSALLGDTIYAEGRSPQYPDELEIYPPRTVDSLVKRGFLESDGSDGYVITQEGRDRLWGR